MASRPLLFTREQLTSMKRVDIQRICKDYGVRANMKTDALIELLLDSINSNMSPLIGRAPPKPQYTSQPRRVSTRSSSRVSSLRSRGASGSSTSNSMTGSNGYGTSNSSARSNNKSKATQHRLGVGRPSAAGGSSYRKSTRSSSIVGGKRRPSRSVKVPVPQVTITEEPEPSSVGNSENFNQSTNGAGSSVNVLSDASTGDDLPARLAHLEAVFREIDPKRSQHSLRDIPSQLAWLKTSIQQREAEVHGLRGELNVCKAEILTLRGEVSRIGFLEGQLRFLQDTFDQMGFLSTSTPSKGKTPRRVSVPLGESNTNTPPSNCFMTLQPVPEIPEIPENTQVHPEATVLAPAAALTLGKRPREVSSGSQASKEIFPSENDRGKYPRLERKRGAERPALREKEVATKHRDDPHLVHPRGAGESAGTSTSGTSSQPPSIGTPPPVHESEAFLDEAALLDLCQAGSSAPRGDMFPQYLQSDEPFSPGSALKARNLIHGNPAQRLNLMSADFEPRRISTAVARPRTPTRSLGHERFRVAVDAAIPNGPPGRNIAHQSFGFDDSAYSYTFAFNTSTNSADFTPHPDVVNTNQPNEMSPPHMPLAVGFGLAAHPISEESPIRGPATTMYGTEIQNDTRFGDFGRDGVASGSTPMNYWGTF